MTILTRSKAATLEPDFGWNACPTIKLDPLASQAISAGVVGVLDPFWKIENMGFLAGGGAASRSWETLRRRDVLAEAVLLGIAIGCVLFFLLASTVRFEWSCR